jgi:hypothetical protein
VAEPQRATPPADIDAEQALVGAAILDADVLERVEIQPTDFYRPAHETMWRALAALNGAHPDRPRGLLDELRERGEIRGPLNGAYIVECVQACRTPAAAHQYARVVHNAARQRRIIETLERGLQRTAGVASDDIEGPGWEAMGDLEAVLSGASHRLSTTTWEPLPLGEVLAGRDLDPPPTMLPRIDGACLLYAAATHVFAGEPGSGKTWLALYAALLELAAGHRVTMVDFEDRADRIVGRLLALGAKPEAIAELFIYLRPAKPLDDAGRIVLERAIAGSSLVVVDGVTEAMTMHGLDLGNNMDIAKFYGMVPRFIADHGPGVVLIDHVTKDAESRGRWAIGGQHKMAGTDGVAYTIVAMERFGRGKMGSSRVVIGRDRPGHVDGIALGKTAAVFHLDATVPVVVTGTLEVPEPIPTGPAGEAHYTVYMHRISMFLTMNPGLRRDEIIDGVRGKATYIRAGLDTLIQEGYVEVDEGEKGTKLHRLVIPYNPDQETL